MKNLHAKPFAVLASAEFAAAFVIAWLVFGMDPKKLLSVFQTAWKAVPIALAGWWVFEKWAWRWPLLRDWFVRIPDLNGTWEGTLRTTWKDPASQESVEPFKAMLTVKQSLNRISCVLRTEQMTSSSYVGDFQIAEEDQLKQLVYCYHTRPRVTHSDKNPPHDGTMQIEVVEKPALKLKAQYWTARMSKGEGDFTRMSEERLEEPPDGFFRKAEPAE